MADDRRGHDDMFEDLDRFFWPEDGESGPAGQEGGAASASDRGAEPPPAEPGDDEAPEEFGGDFLPEGWANEVEDIEVPAPPAPAAREGPDLFAATATPSGPGDPDQPPVPAQEPAEPEPPEPPAADRTGPEEEPEPPSAAPEWSPQSTVDEGTGEMTGEDWGRLREALSDEDDPEMAFLAGRDREPEPDASLLDLQDPNVTGAEEPPGEGSEVSAAEPPEDRPGLSLEDLKKAPPEYRDLPMAEDEADQGAMQTAGRGGPGGPERGEPPPPTEDFAQAGIEEREPGDTGAYPQWEDVDLLDVERTADEVAQEFGVPAGVDDDLLGDLDRPPASRTVKVSDVESFTGPAWEEPGSRSLAGEPALGPEGRNVPAALLTGVVLGAIALIALAWDAAAFAVVAGIVALLGQAELYHTMRRRGFQPATALGLVVGGLTLAGAFLKGEPALLFFLALGVAASFVWYMAAPPKAREGALGNIGVTVLGIVYVPFLAGFVLIVLSQANSGRALMLAILGLTFLYDTSAYIFGTLWGSTPLAPTISPKKSRQGLLGATVVLFIVSWGILPVVLDVLSFGTATGLALVVAVFAPLGDLAESMIKRDLGLKDMGTILPGHGGVLDRIDSVLFVFPAAFYFLRLVF